MCISLCRRHLGGQTSFRRACWGTSRNSEFGKWFTYISRMYLTSCIMHVFPDLRADAVLARARLVSDLMFLRLTKIRHWRINMNDRPETCAYMYTTRIWRKDTNNGGFLMHTALEWILQFVCKVFLKLDTRAICHDVRYI